MKAITDLGAGWETPFRTIIRGYIYLAAYSLAVVVSLKANSKGQVLPRKTAGLDKHLNAVRVHDSRKNDTRDSSSMQTQSVLFCRSQRQAGVSHYQDRERAPPK